MVATKTPEVLSQIAQLEAIWPWYDATLQTIIIELRTAPQVDDSHIRDLAEVHALRIDAIDDPADAFGR